MGDNKCDVCNANEPVGVASSPYVPFSSAYCKECLAQQAEPSWIADFMLEDGIDHIHESVVEGCFVFYKGQYINLAKYAELKE